MLRFCISVSSPHHSAYRTRFLSSQETGKEDINYMTDVGAFFLLTMRAQYNSCLLHLSCLKAQKQVYTSSLLWWLVISPTSVIMIQFLICFENCLKLFVKGYRIFLLPPFDKWVNEASEKLSFSKWSHTANEVAQPRTIQSRQLYIHICPYED